MKTKALIGLITLYCAAGQLHAQVVEKATVFQRFWSGHTTMGFKVAFRHPSTYVDTANANSRGLLTPTDFTKLLATARKKKHHQMKIAGVRFAGLMQIDGQQHEYLYCGPTLLIDLTSNINYWLEPDTAVAFDTKSKQLSLKK